MLLQEKSIQYHVSASITCDEPADVLDWKGDSIEEYWEWTLNALILTEDNGKGQGPDLIVYDGGDTNLSINEGKKADGLFLKDGTVPDLIPTYNTEFKIVLTIIKRLI